MIPVVKKSKNPIRAIREPFGKAGLTVAVLAVVLAMVGGAYAAGALSTQQKKEVERIARKAAGRPAPTGPAGAQAKTVRRELPVRAVPTGRASKSVAPRRDVRPAE